VAPPLETTPHIALGDVMPAAPNAVDHSGKRQLD